MALNNLGLGFVFKAKDFASPVMQKVEGRFKKLDSTTAAAAGSLQKGMMTVAGGAVVAAAGIAALNFGFKAADAAGNFNQQLEAVGQITKATDQEMKDLKETALDVGLRTKFSPDEIIEGLKNMGAAGLKASESMEAIEPAALLATSGQIALGDASNAIVGTLRSFSIETSEAGLVADKLTRAMQLSNTQGEDFQAGLSKAGAVMGGFNQSLDTTLVLFGALRNANIDASSSGTALRESIRRLASDAGAQNTITSQGVDIYDKQTGAMRDLGEVMYDLIDKTANLSVEERNMIAVQAFGARGILAFNAASKLTTKVMRDGVEVTLSQRDAYRELMRATESAKGTNVEFNEALLDTYQGQKEILSGAIDTLKVVFGDGFAKVLKPLVRFVANTIGNIAGFFRDIPEPVRNAMSAMFLIFGAVVALAGVVLAGAGAFVLIKAAIIALSPVLLALAQPALILIGVGLALVAVFKTIKMAFDENIGGLGDGLRDVFGRFKLYLGAITQLLSGDGKLKGETLKKLLEPANAGILSMVQRFQQARFRVQRFFQGLKEGFLSIIRTAAPTFARLKDAFTALAEALGFGSDAMALMTGSSEEFRGSGETFGEVLGRVMVTAIELLVGAIHVAIGFINGMKIAWAILKPVVMTVVWLFVKAVEVINWLLGAFGLLTGEGREGEAMFSGLGKALGVLVAGFVAWKAAIIAARVALIAYRGVLLAVKLAQAGMAAMSALSAAGLLGPAGLVLAAGAAGYAIGTWADQTLGLSDRLAGVNKHLRMTEEQLNRIGLTNKRGAAFATLEEAAKKRDMTVDKYLDVRSQEIAGESTAKAKGFTQELIRYRLEHGEDVFKDISDDEMKKFGISGIDAKKDGEVEKERGKEDAARAAFVGALDEHSKKQAGRKRQGGKVPVVLEAQGEQLAKAMIDAKALADSYDWEADALGAGT